MKVGDIVRHKLSPEVGRLRIDKISEEEGCISVARCYRLDGPEIVIWLEVKHEHWTAICALENLELL